VLRLITMTVLLADLLLSSSARAQTAPASPEHPWHGSAERNMQAYARNVTDSKFTVDQSQTYSLAELIDLAQAHNPATRGFGDYAK
jgi:outer membrane protein